MIKILKVVLAVAFASAIGAQAAHAIDLGKSAGLALGNIEIHKLQHTPIQYNNDSQDSSDSQDNSDTDTSAILLDGIKKIGRTAQCSQNCNLRHSACNNRCVGSYRNRDPNGVACVQECLANYNECTSGCQD